MYGQFSTEMNLITTIIGDLDLSKHDFLSIYFAISLQNSNRVARTVKYNNLDLIRQRVRAKL